MPQSTPPHLRAVIKEGVREAGGASAQLPTTSDRVAFIVERRRCVVQRARACVWGGAGLPLCSRRRDALNCYLRTCCMRLAGDIVMGDTGGVANLLGQR